MSSRNHAAEFKLALEAAGLCPGEIIGDREAHRCLVEGQTGTPTRGGGMYRFYPGAKISSGWFVNYKTMDLAGSYWRSAGSDDLTTQDLAEFRVARETLAAAAKANQIKMWATAARNANELMNVAQSATAENAYLKSKGVRPAGDLRELKNGLLAVPVYQSPDELAGVQQIPGPGQSGGKKFALGTRVGGSYFPIDGADKSTVYICEGIATGLSVHHCTGGLVLVAFTAGNLKAVAIKAKELASGSDIVICGDDDWATAARKPDIGNPGRIAAEAAAQACGGRAVFPIFYLDRGTDFNDLHQSDGPAAVQRCIGISDLREKLIWRCAHADCAEMYILETASVKKYTHDFKFGDLWERPAGASCFRKSLSIKSDISEVLVRVMGELLLGEIENIENQAWEGADSDETRDEAMDCLQKAYNKALKWVRTDNFLASTVNYLKQMPELAAEEINDWNAAPYCLPCIDLILDFSGPEPIARLPHPRERFRWPLPYKAADILAAASCDGFDTFLSQIFRDPGNLKMALQCLGAMISGAGLKYFLIWHGGHGSNGKNTLFDLMRLLLGERRTPTVANALICKGDDGDKKFGTKDLDGALLPWVDEAAGGLLLLDSVKRLSSGSGVKVQDKGVSSYEVRQSWILSLLTNSLPDFRPAHEPAFLNRLRMIPCTSVFYSSQESYDEYVEVFGVDPAKLFPSKEGIEAEIAAQEGPAVIMRLAREAIKFREGGQVIAESESSKQLKAVYKKDQDDIGAFFETHFRMSETGKVDNARILELWQIENPKSKKGKSTIRKEMKQRYPQLRDAVWNMHDVIAGKWYTRRGLSGIIEIPDSEPAELGEKIEIPAPKPPPKPHVEQANPISGIIHDNHDFSYQL